MKSSRQSYMFSKKLGSRWYKLSQRQNKKPKVVLTKLVSLKFDDEKDQTIFEKSDHIERVGNETHKSTRIKFAAIYDDEEEIGEILNSEASVGSVQTLLSMRDKHGQPCIFYALESRSKRALACLLRHVNDKACLIASNGETVLHVVTKIGDVDMLRSVLPVVDLVGDIVDRADDDNGRTPLHLTAKFNHVEIAKELLIHGAKLDLVDATGKTPIFMAASRGHASMLQIFVEHGREKIEDLFLGSRLPGRRYGNLLQVAVESGDESTVQVCLDQDPEIVRKCLAQEMEHGEGSLLHSACENGMEQCVVCVVETMKDQAELYMSRKDKQGFAPIHKAAINNYDHLMKYLGSSRLFVNQTTNYSQTALVLAAEQGHIKVVEELLNLGADFRITDDIGRTVLHYATAFPDVLRILLQKKDLCQLLINAKEKDGHTPVHMAALRGLHESLNVLLEYGADIKVFTNAARSPLHCAASSESLEVVQLVLANESAFVNKADATGKTPLHTAASYGSIDVVRCLLDYGALVVKDTNMYSALHIAADKGHLDVVQLLIAAKSKIINWENKYKRTALIAAASTGKSDVVKFLLESGAAITKDYELFNCLDWSLVRNYKETAMTIMCHSRWKEIFVTTRHGSEGTMVKLIQKMPEVAQRVLSNSMTFQGHPDTKEYVKYYDFLCLQDILQDNPDGDTIEAKKWKPLTAIETMINTECYSCLCHTVCCKFLKTKWMEFGWKIHTFSLVLYIAFLASFTTYAFRLVSYTRTKKSSDNDEFHIKFAMALCVLFTSINTFKEVIQLLCYKTRYFQGKTNYLECVMHVSVFIFVAKTDSNGAVKTSFQWQACSVGLFLAWFNLVLYLQRFASYGIYVLMMRRIFVTCIKVLSLFIFFLVAFAAAFIPIMDRIPGFTDFGLAMVTTIVMSTGEIDFKGSFLDNALNENFKVLRMLMVVTFIVLMPIILMNLLLALAIDDTSSIMQQAKLRKHIQMAKLIIELERKRYLWPWSFKTRNFVPTLVERPNKRANFPIIEYLWEYLSYGPDFTSAEDTTTTTAEHNVPTTKKRLEWDYATMMVMMKEVKDQITDLQNGMKEVHKKSSRLQNPVHSSEGTRDVWTQARIRSESSFSDEIKARIERKRRAWTQSSNFSQVQSVSPWESVHELEDDVFTSQQDMMDEWSREKKETDPELVELKELHKKVSTGMDKIEKESDLYV